MAAGGEAMIVRLKLSSEGRRALIVSFTYALAAVAWLVVADRILESNFSLASTARGLAVREVLLIAVTSLVLLFLMLARTGPRPGPGDQPRKPDGRADRSRDALPAAGALRDLADPSITESEQRLRNIARNIPGVVYQLRVKPSNAYSIDYLSPKAAEIFGVHPKLQGSDWRELGAIVHPDDQAAFLASTSDVITRRADWQFEGRLAGSDDAPRWIQGLSSASVDGEDLIFHGVFLDITQRKRAEQALRQSQERFQRALENIPDAVVLYDHDLKVQYINSASTRLTGRPASDFIGKSDNEIWPSEICESYLPILRHALHSRSTCSGEIEIALPGRGQLHLRITCVPVTCDHGDVREIVVITHDLTMSKAREREIERLNGLYATLCRLNQSIVHVTSAEELFHEVCRVTVAHARFKLVWVGWHDRQTHEIRPVACAGESVGYLDLIKIFADDRPEGRGPAGLCIRSGKPCIVDDWQHELRGTPWGDAAMSHGLLSVAALPILLNGDVSAVFLVYAGEKGVFQDKEIALLQEAATTISFALNHLEQEEKRRQAEGLLREREAQYRAVIETSPDGFSMCDAENRFLEVNDAYVRLSGYSREELLRMSIPDVLAQEQAGNVATRCDQIRRDGSALFESLHRSKDGTVWPGEVSVAYWPEAGGRFLTFVRNVHRRNRSEALLRTRFELSDLAARSSVDELLQSALESAQLYTGSRNSHFHFVDEKQQVLIFHSSSAGSHNAAGPEQHVVQTLPIGQAVPGRSAITRGCPS